MSEDRKRLREMALALAEMQDEIYRRTMRQNDSWVQARPWVAEWLEGDVSAEEVAAC